MAETFAFHGTDPGLRDCVHVRRLHRRSYDPDVGIAKDSIERRGVFHVSIAEEEPRLRGGTRSSRYLILLRCIPYQVQYWVAGTVVPTALTARLMRITHVRGLGEVWVPGSSWHNPHSCYTGGSICSYGVN